MSDDQNMPSHITLPKVIPVLGKSITPICYLRRLSCVDDVSKELVECMTNWRNQFGAFFMTQFHATPSRTEKWLRESVILDKTRAMYMIEDEERNFYGHVGVMSLNSNRPELDNMIRGRSGIDSQVMRFAEAALLAAIFASPLANAVCLHVFSRNWIPIGIHQSFGFRITGKIPLSKIITEQEIRYVSDFQSGEDAKIQYLTMELTRTEFQQFHKKFYNELPQ